MTLHMASKFIECTEAIEAVLHHALQFRRPRRLFVLGAAARRLRKKEPKATVCLQLSNNSLSIPIRIIRLRKLQHTCVLKLHDIGIRQFTVQYICIVLRREEFEALKSPRILLKIL